jgi:cell division protein FtsL
MQLSLTTLEILLIIGLIFSCIMVIYNTHRIKSLQEENRYQELFIKDVKHEFRKSENDLYEHVRTSVNNLNDLISKRFKDLKKDKPKKENQK